MLVAFASSFNATTWALFGSGAFSVATICFGTSKIFENFSTKTDISYGIYLYHFPVVQTLVYFLDRRQDRFLLISMTLILSGVFAYMSAKIIEEPVLRWVRRIQANKQTFAVMFYAITSVYECRFIGERNLLFYIYKLTT